MTITEAKRIKDAFYRKSVPSEEDVFIFTEALSFLIEETSNPNYMLELGGYYYGIRNFELALKYYELAAEYKLVDAYDCLGYIYYYGRTGKKDYEKAFHYFSLAADAGNIQAEYKIADMYKNGYFVEKNYSEYKRIIEGLYPKVRYAQFLNEPLPEIFTRLAAIRTEEGRIEESVDLYMRAKDFLAQRIKYNDFFGDLNIMMWLTDSLYKLIEFDYKNFDFYDLYFLLTSPCNISFRRGNRTYTVSAVAETEEQDISVCYDGKWYRSRESFFKEATVDNQKLTAVYDELHGFEVT